MKTSIGVVIVTYNRLSLLKQAIKAYENQIKKPEYIVIVNNNSSDGTTEYLRVWEKEKNNINKYLINLEKNIGGSGGFYEGLDKAKNLDAEWIWVGDDDAFPVEDTLLVASQSIQKVKNKKVSAICGTVMNNGKIDLVHRRRIEKNFLQEKEVQIEEEEYKKEYFELDEFSYVGTILNKNIMEKVGLPKRDYFIYYDDTEHSLRMRQEGEILCFPKIIVEHNTGSGNNNLTWKSYYGYRNLLDTYKNHMNKKSYMYLKNKLKLKSFLVKDKKHAKLLKQAIKDCEKNNFGINMKYAPGKELI